MPENQAFAMEFNYTPDFTSDEKAHQQFSAKVHPFLQDVSAADVEYLLRKEPSLSTAVASVSMLDVPPMTAPLIESLFFLYSNVYGRCKGDSCLFCPTCSHFSQLAIAEYGFLTGFALTAGRLARSHTNFDGFYPEVTVDQGKRFLDLPQHQLIRYYETLSSEDYIYASD